MDIIDGLVDGVTALGNGIYSVGEDLALGIERSAEGLGARGSGRMVQIGAENEYLAKNLYAAFSNAPTALNSPLGKIVTRILMRYYDHFPEEQLRELAIKAGVIATGYVGGRMVIGTTLARTVSSRIILKLAASAGFRAIAARLGISAGTSASLVGIPIGMTMLQGVAQRASMASRRLSEVDPELYATLRREGGLDMIYFVVEKPLEKYIRAIRAARQNRAAFEDAVRRQGSN